ncbi:MAG: glucokinase [Chroococcales cyanobacterium]
MTILLAGDIGGTKTILRLVQVTEAGTSLNTVYQSSYTSAAYPDLVPIVQEFLAQADQEVGKQNLPQRACFAIAGPVVNNTSKLTNLSWSLDNQRLQQDLGMEKVSLINDFAAVSYGIVGLEENDIKTLQSGTYQKTSPIGVIGAGTGLGEGFLVPVGSEYQAYATEGGHTDFAPRSELEFKLLEYLHNQLGIDRVSVERVVSGQGIVSIYQFLRDTQFAAESAEVGNVVRQWEQEDQKIVDPAAIISKAALEKRDRLCEKTMQVFVEAYAAEAGNLALKLLSYGGLYIAGGIAAKILPLIQEYQFAKVFKQKGRMTPLLEQIPVHIILNPQVGLLGSVLYGLKG